MKLGEGVEAAIHCCAVLASLEGDATMPGSALAEADAAWLVSSVRLAAPIRAIDGRELAVDAELTASFNRYLLTPRD